MKKNNFSKVDETSLTILKKYNCHSLINKKGEIESDTKFTTTQSTILSFANDMLNEFISVRTISDFVKGINKGHYKVGGLKSLYTYAAIRQIVELRNKLNAKCPLFEIGLKREDRDLVKATIEKIVGKTNEIGNVQIYHNVYTLFEEPTTGVLLSLYTNEMDEWVLNNRVVAISSSAYIGIIVPDFELCYKISKALVKAGCNEIEWPFNGYGGLSIRDLNRKNITTEQAELNRANRGKNGAKTNYTLESPFVMNVGKKLLVKNY